MIKNIKKSTVTIIKIQMEYSKNHGRATTGRCLLTRSVLFKILI
jgi:hypothetical protein